jgi:acetylglutamate kinase
VKGVLRDKKDPGSLYKTLRAAEAERLIKRRVIDGGMIPKALSCINAIKGGVKKAHILDASMPHALLLEIFTDTGIGTEIVK